MSHIPENERRLLVKNSGADLYANEAVKSLAGTVGANLEFS